MLRHDDAMTDEADGQVPDSERRATHRQRVLRGALVVFSGHGRVFDCSVLNLSDEGAKIRLETTIGVPDEFELLIPSQHRIAPAKAIWRTAQEMGVTVNGPWRQHTGQG